MSIELLIGLLKTRAQLRNDAAIIGKFTIELSTPVHNISENHDQAMTNSNDGHTHSYYIAWSTEPPSALSPDLRHRLFATLQTN